MDYDRLPWYPVLGDDEPSQQGLLAESDQTDRWEEILTFVLPAALVLLVLSAFVTLIALSGAAFVM